MNSTSAYCAATADSDSSAPPDAPLSLSKIAATAAVVLIILACIIGNVLLVLAIVLDRRLRKRKNWLYISLAVADLLVGTCVVTFALANDVMGHWIFGPTFCQIWISLDVMCSTASIVNISAIAFDRYMHVSSPFTYQRVMNRTRMFLIIVAVWVLSVAISFIPIKLGLHLDKQSSASEPRADFSSTTVAYSGDDDDAEPDAEDSGVAHTMHCKFDVNATYAITSSCVSFFAPSICLVLVYGRLHQIARSHYAAIQQTTVGKSVSQSQNTSTPTWRRGAAKASEIDSSSPATNGGRNDTNTSTATNMNSGCHYNSLAFISHWTVTPSHNGHGKFFQERKATITLGFLIGVFLICWSPFFTCNVLAPLCKSCISDFLFALVTYLGYCNSALDPVAIFLTNNEFRKSFRKLLTSCWTPQLPLLPHRVHRRRPSSGAQRSTS